MNNKFKIFPIIGVFLLTSCQDKESKINYNQDYISAYISYKIDSEKEGYQYRKKVELDVTLFKESKEFFIDLINSNFENVNGPSDGSPGTYAYYLILTYEKRSDYVTFTKSDYLRISKNELDPITNVVFQDEKSNDIYSKNGYMTYEYYKRMFDLIDQYETLLSNVEWEEIKWGC